MILPYIAPTAQEEKTAALPAPPPIVPTPAPAYQPPIVDAATQPSPMVAPSFPGQTLGKGGTPFGAQPMIYLRPYVIEFKGLDVDPEAVTDQSYPYVPRDRPGTVPTPNILPPRKGEDAIAPIITGQQPAKGDIPVTQPSISPVPPVKGSIAGFDLAKVPFWAWLVAAAVLGAKLLK